jgi:hypothetical protein
MPIVTTKSGEYESPMTDALYVMPEGVLCKSGSNTNEGVEFEDWN